LLLVILAAPVPTQDAGRIIAAVPSDFPSHYVIGQAGRPEDIDIDIMETIVDGAGVNVEYRGGRYRQRWFEA